MSRLLHDAQQLITQVHQSPSVSTSMTADTLSYSPSLTHSAVTSCSDATYASPAWPQLQSAVCSPAQPNPRLAEGTSSIDSMSTPCFSGSNVGGGRTGGLSAVASSPVPPSASSLSSDLSGTLTAEDSVGLFIPALVLPMRHDTDQDILHREASMVRAGARHTPARPQLLKAEAAAKGNPSDTGPLAAQSGGSTGLSGASGHTHEQQSFCRPSSPSVPAGDVDFAPAPITPELSMPCASSVSGNIHHGQPALREKDAANSSDAQSSLVPAEWQGHQDASGSCSGVTDSGLVGRSAASETPLHPAVRPASVLPHRVVAPTPDASVVLCFWFPGSWGELVCAKVSAKLRHPVCSSSCCILPGQLAPL